MTECAALFEKLCPGFEDGNYLPPIIDQTFDLDDATSAYEKIAKGTRGRVVPTF